MKPGTEVAVSVPGKGEMRYERIMKSGVVARAAMQMKLPRMHNQFPEEDDFGESPNGPNILLEVIVQEPWFLWFTKSVTYWVREADIYMPFSTENKDAA